MKLGPVLLLAVGCAAQPAAPPQYLVFQHFTGAGIPDPSDPDGAVVFVQTTGDLVSDYETYIDRITTMVGVTPAPDRRLGFAIGPLALDLGDQVLVQSIQAGFEAARAKQVAVVFHLDISHFWKLVADGDGKLSEGTGALDVHEWMDWNGTIAAAGQHPGSDDWQPRLLPSMCFECDRVKALVDHVTSVIGPALAAGDPDLLGAVIIGWEAGSNNPLGYHSLTLDGFGASDSAATLRHAQQQILHDYLERWARDLNVTYGIAKTKLYTHITNCTQWDIDQHTCDPAKANGPDAFWEMFNDYSIGGISGYANSAAEDLLGATAAAAGGQPWGMMEGTNIDILHGTPYRPSDISYETYLAKIFNHGATMADIFGVEGGGVDASTTDEAIAAYRKFLTGGDLKE